MNSNITKAPLNKRLPYILFLPLHFTGKEKDPETGYSYFGARYLEHEMMSMWLSVDPMADKYPSVSPYAYCAWNPVRLVDPDGEEMWWPDEEGNWIAEVGDDARSLAECAGITLQAANDLLVAQGFDPTESIPENSKVCVDNQYTRSIHNAKDGTVRTMSPTALKSVFSQLTLKEQEEWMTKWIKDQSDIYNCWGSVISGSFGEEIRGGTGILSASNFDKLIQKLYIRILPEDAVPGHTVIVMKDKDGTTTHGAIYYGHDNNGNMYVFTKNGWVYPPIVTLIGNVEERYGYVSGFYNFKGLP